MINLNKNNIKKITNRKQSTIDIFDIDSNLAKKVVKASKLVENGGKTTSKKEWIKQNIVSYILSIVGTIFGYASLIFSIFCLRDLGYILFSFIIIIAFSNFYDSLEHNYNYKTTIEHISFLLDCSSLSSCLHEVWNKQIIELQQKLKKEEIKDDISNRE